MDTEQIHWAAQLRALPSMFRAALRMEDDRVIRHRPAEGEWSAIEVLGHMVDKVALWSSRAERIWKEERPNLPVYDQDAAVRTQGYQQADPAALCERFQQGCEHFAALVGALPAAALQREGVHSEFGILTPRHCIEYTLESGPEHLAQLRAAQADALTSGASE